MNIETGAKAALPGAYLALAGTSSALIALADGRQTVLGDGRYDDAWFGVDEGVLWTVRGDSVRRARWDGVGPAGAMLPPPGRGYPHEGKIFGFGLIPDGGAGGERLGVMTDSGVSIWRDRHFEHLTLPDLTARSRFWRCPATGPGVRGDADRCWRDAGGTGGSGQRAGV